MSTMEAVTKAVEKALGDEMPDCFCLITDCSTHGTDIYLAVYGWY